MTVKLKKPLKSLRKLNIIDPSINELAALLVGAKDVLFASYSPASREYIRKLLAVFNLKHLSLHPQYVSHNTRNRKDILISRSGRLLRKAKLASKNPISFEWGALLGYPECCVKSYLKWNEKQMGKIDIIPYIFNKTSADNHFSFLLNNVFNYFSRQGSKKSGQPSAAEKNDFLEINEINQDLLLPSLQIISWHPCSYRCQASLKKGESIYGFLKEYVPQYALNRKKYLSRPIIYFDKFKFLALEKPKIIRRKNGVSVSFRNISKPRSLLEAGVLTENNQLTIKNGKLFSSNFKTGVSLGSRAILLNFSGN